MPEKPRTPVSWSTIDRVADEAQQERLEARSEEELGRELREAGFADDAADRLLGRALAAGDPRRRRRWGVLLAAAAAAVAAAVVLLAVLAWTRRDLPAHGQDHPAADAGADTK